MTKVFEDYFSELQADMVSICLEYVSNKADMIFIYASNEFGQFSSDVFL
jgi:cell fate regulator YaaT (PSP1 superfamily)